MCVLCAGCVSEYLLWTIVVAACVFTSCHGKSLVMVDKSLVLSILVVVCQCYVLANL